MKLLPGAFKQQAISWTNVDPGLCLQMASLSLFGLKTNFCGFEEVFWITRLTGAIATIFCWQQSNINMIFNI